MVIQPSQGDPARSHWPPAYCGGPRPGSSTSVSVALITTIRRRLPAATVHFAVIGAVAVQLPSDPVMPCASVAKSPSRTPSRRISAPATGSAVASEVTTKRVRSASSTVVSVRSVTCSRSHCRLLPSVARRPTR